MKKYILLSMIFFLCFGTYAYSAEALSAEEQAFFNQQQEQYRFSAKAQEAFKNAIKNSCKVNWHTFDFKKKEDGTEANDLLQALAACTLKKSAAAMITGKQDPHEALKIQDENIKELKILKEKAHAVK